MPDEIDRSVEPKIGADAKKTEDLPAGVRVRARGKKDSDSKKISKKKSAAAGQKEDIKSEKVNTEERSARLAGKKVEEAVSRLNKKISDVELKIDSLSDNLSGTVRAMEDNGANLYEQESKFSDSMTNFQIYKDSRQKASTILVASSVAATVVAIMFLVFAVSSFSTKTDFFDSVSTALGTRIVDMNEGLDNFELARAELSVLQEQIEGLQLRLEESQLSYLNTEQDIQDQLLNYTENINQELSDQTANLRGNISRLDGQFSAFNSQILDFGDELEQSKVTLNEIGSEARSMNELKEIMNALLTLEREKYYEAINGGASENDIGQVRSSSSEAGPTFNRYYTQ
jgi:chromosome segregation ATPase